MKMSIIIHKELKKVGKLLKIKLKLSIILNIRNKINLSLAIIYDLTLFKSL